MSQNYAALQYECEQFLYWEAKLLDTNQYNEWFELLAEDLDYKVPIRVTRERAAGLGYSQAGFHLWEDRASIRARVHRLNTNYAFAEDPPSRTRRFVANVVIQDVREKPGYTEVDIENYLLLYRAYGDSHEYSVISGLREDTLRKHPTRWQIARRQVFLDQTTLGDKNIAVFL